MNLILFPVISDQISIPRSDPRYQHITQILKSNIQDELWVGELNGLMGKARVMDLRQDAIVLKPGELTIPPPRPLDLTLIMALPRPPVFQRTLSAVTSLGVKRIYLIHTDRVEKSYWGSHVLQPDEIHRSLILGLEQARDTVLPQVYLRRSLKAFVLEELNHVAEGSLKILAHPGENLGVASLGQSRKVTLVIGPEGGFLDFEVDIFKKSGFCAVQMGERILRVETAVISLIAKTAHFS